MRRKPLTLPSPANTSPTPSVISVDTSRQPHVPRITLQRPGVAPLEPNPLDEYFEENKWNCMEPPIGLEEDDSAISEEEHAANIRRTKRKAVYDQDETDTAGTKRAPANGLYRQFVVNGHTYRVSNGTAIPSKSLPSIVSSIEGDDKQNTGDRLVAETGDGLETEIEYNEIPGFLGRLWLAISFLAKGRDSTHAFYGEADIGHASVMDLLHFVVSKDNYATNRQTARYKLAIVVAMMVVAMLLISFIYITVMPRWKVYSCGDTVPPNQCGSLENWHDMVVFCTPSLSLLQFDIINRDNKRLREGINLGPAKNCKLEYYSELTVIASKTSRPEFDNREIHLSEDLSLCLQQLLAAKKVLTLPHAEIVVEYGCTSIGKYELPVTGVIDRVVGIINYILP